MKEFSVLQKIGDTPGKNDKLALLKGNATEDLKKILYLTYNRFLTYRVKQIEQPKEYNVVQPNITGELETLLMMLANHETGSTDAKNMIKRLLAKCTKENATWVERIITRDLKIGIDESTINKAFPGLVPVFDVQLAFPVYSGGKNPKNYWPTLKYPVIVEEKLDGMRAVAVCKGGKVSFFSREGHLFDDRGVFAAEILRLRPGTDFVLDGEIIAKRFNPDNKTAVKNKDSNWVYEQAKSMLKNEDTTPAEIKEYLGYYTWDILELDYFESQGSVGKKLSLADRKVQLKALFERNPSLTFANLYLVPNAMANSEAEVKELFTAIRALGGEVYSCKSKAGKTITYTIPMKEGCMIKDPEAAYDFKRSTAVLKMKQFYTADLRISNAYSGKPGTKYEGVLGGLVLLSDCGSFSTDCGSGFDDEMRWELWNLHKKNALVGKIVEVSYQEITADGSLRFPVFIRIRDDKSTTNVEAA